ncbi:MAG: hypothetical protein ABSC94_30785 [Polyangiaceae bacterium]|jgi:hypothetical protein
MGRFVESKKEPLDNRIWYNYANQTKNPNYWGALMSGSTNPPTAVGQVLADGTTKLWQYQYNAQGRSPL